MLFALQYLKYLARMRVPKMVKNGFKSIFAYVDSLWICFMSVFWLCLRNKNHFTPISEQACALKKACSSEDASVSSSSVFVGFSANNKYIAYGVGLQSRSEYLLYSWTQILKYYDTLHCTTSMRCDIT